MKCPVCSGTDLLMTERQGVEIDSCPGCRGVWLDRGELDKIIERANAESAASSASRTTREDDGRDERRESDHDHRGSSGRDASSKKKKGGFLGDILGGLGGD
jgi:Zn-finger nucleic acid-binding protein